MKIYLIKEFLGNVLGIKKDCPVLFKVIIKGAEVVWLTLKTYVINGIK